MRDAAQLFCHMLPSISLLNTVTLCALGTNLEIGDLLCDISSSLVFLFASPLEVHTCPCLPGLENDPQNLQVASGAAYFLLFKTVN